MALYSDVSLSSGIFYPTLVIAGKKKKLENKEFGGKGD